MHTFLCITHRIDRIIKLLSDIKNVCTYLFKTELSVWTTTEKIMMTPNFLETYVIHNSNAAQILILKYYMSVVHVDLTLCF